MANLCIFEDNGYAKLLPMAYTRPVYDLKCGMNSLRDKIATAYPGAKLYLHCREYLAEVLSQEDPGIPVNVAPEGSTLFVNGRALADEEFSGKIPLEGGNEVFTKGNVLVAARVTAPSGVDLSAPIGPEQFSGNISRADVELISYIWDLVHHNSDILTGECISSGKLGTVEGKVYDGVHIIEKANVYIAKGASVKPGVVLDAEGGPIFIDEGAKVFPNAVIEGPAYIGKKSQIKIGAKIYEGTTIGEVSKIGGEVEESIVHSYSNKQHDGFLGHSYIGMWVNLGADTNNSDLKNNYGNVRVYVDGESVDSGTMFVGLTIADHSKSGINTMFNTGTVVGVCCNVFGSGFPQKYIPSFSWGGTDSLATYRLDKALEVAERVMGRRDIELTDAMRKLLLKVFDLTEEERERFNAAIGDI